MKSTRKHELQTNELADAVGRAIQWIKPHAQLLGYIGLAGFVAVFVLVILPAIRGEPAENLAAASFNAAQKIGDTQSVKDFLTDYADAPQVPAAKLLLAERLLSHVVRGAAGAAPGANNEAILAEAEDYYRQVAKESKPLEPMAHVGLALLMVQRGDVTAGQAALKEVVAKWPLSIAAEKARAHLEALAGYEPTAFSDEPLEEPKPPEAEGTTPAADEKPAETTQPAPEPKPAPAETKTEPKPDTKETPEPKPAG